MRLRLWGRHVACLWSVMPGATQQRPTEIRSLTAIRGVAALWVVLHHFNLIYRWGPTGPERNFLFMGYAGVDLFFVLSGFILTVVYQTLRLRDVPRFLLRRLVRIFPLHLFILAIIVGPVFAAGIWPAKDVGWINLPAVAFLIQPYLGLDHGLWNPISWSASIELSCYLWFPLFVFPMRKTPAAVLVLVWGLISWSVWLGQPHFASTWTGLPALERGWSDFALGVITSFLTSAISVGRAASALVELAGFCLILWGAISQIPAAIPLGAAALITALKQENTIGNTLLRASLPHHLGQVSFSIYLLQMLVIRLFAALWPTANTPALTAAFILRQMLLIASLIILSGLTYRYIERPGQNLANWLGKRKPAQSS